MSLLCAKSRKSISIFSTWYWSLYLFSQETSCWGYYDQSTLGM